MANFAAQMDKWTEKAKRNVGLVVKDSAQDVCELMTRRQDSVKETGGSYKEGFVPVDTGELINAPHAPAMEYGAVHAGGRFFVRNAVQNWPQIVAAIIAATTALYAHIAALGLVRTRPPGSIPTGARCN